MAIKLKITRASGEVVETTITPVVEVAFEAWAKCGFAKAFRENERQSDLYWLAWKTLSLIEDHPPFGDRFLESIASVEIAPDTNPN